MPEYEFIGDDLTEFPGLGLSVKPGDVVTLEKPIDHPLLKPVKKPKEKTDAAS